MSHLHHKVSALIDGELSPHARARALSHARGCPQCRQEIAETLEVKKRVTELAPAEVSADLLDVLASAVPPRVVPSPADGPPLLRRVFVGVGSMSAVVVALAYVVGAPEVSQAAPVAPPVNELTAGFTDSTGLAALADPSVDAQPKMTSATTTPVGFGTYQQAGLATTGSGSRSGDDPAAVGLLREAAMAPERVTFKGMRVVRSYVQGGVESFSIDIQHVPAQGTTFDVHDGPTPSGSALFVSDGEAADDGIHGGTVAMLAAAYDLALEGPQVILGRRTTVISARQGGEVRARFWVDDATGLLLRRELFAGGRLVRWSGFTWIVTHRHGFMTHLPPEVAAPPTTLLPTRQALSLTDRGWSYPAQLSGGFQLSHLCQVDIGDGMLRADYTDGLSTFSVFEERGSLDTSSLGGFRTETFAGDPLYVRDGLPMTIVWQSGDTVFTVVTDVPEQLAGGLMSSFPHVVVHPAGGVTSRVGKGLSRLVSAVAP